MRHFYIKLFLLLLTFQGMHIGLVSAQPDPPSLRCISVESNGSVTLTWIAPVDTGLNFGGYHIYYSSVASGPFLPIDSIFNYNTLSTTVTGVNASTASLLFYIKTREGCCSNYSAASDTLRSIRMIVTPLSNEHVRLNWNRTHTPPLATSLSNFVLSKELTSGTFTNFKTLPDTTTLDTNIFCNKYINYKVTQADLSGCVSVSSIDGELFRDTKGPAQPLIDTVSFDYNTGEALISWFPDSSADTQGYVIYQFNGISYDSIGAVSGINSLFFANTLSSANNTVETYTVAAYDSCKNLSPPATNHKTVLLSTDFVKCDALVTLEWTAYDNMNNGVSRYEVWVRENSGTWIRESIVPPNILTYEKQLTLPGALYEFIIRVVGGTGQTASSNLETITADILSQPDYLYIRSASVSGSGVNINCYVDPGGSIKNYLLYRSTSFTGPFTFVSSVNYTPSSQIQFNDAFAGADKKQVFYKITSIDSCGKELTESNLAGTVYLNAEGSAEYTSTLTWIPYIGWDYAPGSYSIYRVENGSVQATPFVTVQGDTLTYFEDVSQLQINEGSFCYVVKAIQDSLSIYGFSDSAYSNIACAAQPPSVFIPNAFTPAGKNPVFKPVLLFNDPQFYSLQIFNRWGQLVFSSEIPEVGWRGDYNNGDAPQGLYAYLLVFKGLNKKEIRRSGTVTLLR